MGIHGIARYTGSALIFAVAVCALWLAIRRLRGRRFRRGDGLRLLFVGYIAALAQIIALRVGLQAPRWLGQASRLNAVPLATTAAAWRAGVWPLIYHVVGNTLWFVPLGALLSRLRSGWRVCRVLLAGAALSLALETAQLLLGTGVTDVDDVLLNALGTLLGYAAARSLQRWLG